MNELKEKVLNMVLASIDVDYESLDDLIEVLYKDEDYSDMLVKFYLSFFIATHQIELESVLIEFSKLNLFQKRGIILEVAKEIGQEESFLFYEGFLKERNTNYQSNAVRVIEGMLNDSDGMVASVVDQIKELSDFLPLK